MASSTQKLYLLLLLSVILHSAYATKNVEDELLIGWKGERSKARKPWVETISWSPRAFIFHNFLSNEEADHMKKLALPWLKRSKVVDSNGNRTVNPYRTSYGTFLRRAKDPVLRAIEERTAAWTRTPVSHQEDVQVLFYREGQKYDAHLDSLIDSSPRVMTALLYLEDTPEGGETTFPYSTWAGQPRHSMAHSAPADAAIKRGNASAPDVAGLRKRSSTHTLEEAVNEGSAHPSSSQSSSSVSSPATSASPLHHGPFSDCVPSGVVAFRPRKGDALLFHSVRPDGTHDPRSLHAGCSVIRGAKWTATIWIHSMPFHTSDLQESGIQVLPRTRMPADALVARSNGTVAGAVAVMVGKEKGGNGGASNSTKELGAVIAAGGADDMASLKGGEDGQALFLEVEEPGLCLNTHSLCGLWAKNGECARNAEYMNEKCARACGKCNVCDGQGDVNKGNTNNKKKKKPVTGRRGGSGFSSDALADTAVSSPKKAATSEAEETTTLRLSYGDVSDSLWACVNENRQRMGYVPYTDDLRMILSGRGQSAGGSESESGASALRGKKDGIPRKQNLSST